MGGKKKPTITSLERRMRKMREKERREKKEEKKILVKKASLDEIMKDISNLKYVTPYIVYQRYGMKISEAKRLLKKMCEEGLLTLYSSGRRVPIYIPKSS